MYRIGQEEIDAITRVINSRDLFKINGGAQECMHFEEELKEKFGVKYALLMTSGSAALTSALIGMGVGPGDEVIVPAYTYIATAIAVTATGAVPVIGSLDAEKLFTPDGGEIDQSLLSAVGRGYYVVAILEPGKEPTNHALRDLIAARERPGDVPSCSCANRPRRWTV